MNRTRIIFFGVLAVYLAIITTTLALRIASLNLARQLFIASTIFSVGVVLLDFLGILGGHHGGDTTGDITAGHIAGDHMAADLGGHGDVGHVAGELGGHGDVGHVAVHVTGEHGADHHADEAQHSVSNHQNAAPILSALTYLRLFVYFCLGFGPMGWVAMTTGQSVFVSLALAAVVGVAAVFLAQAFFRFQRRDTDSQLASADLVGQRATVIVPLDGKTMGKVRIQVGPVVTEQYALAARAGAAFENGEEVTVTSVTDECVYVR